MGNLLLVAATLGAQLVVHDLLHGVLELVHLSLHLVVLVLQHDDVGSGNSTLAVLETAISVVVFSWRVLAVILLAISFSTLVMASRWWTS